MPFASSRVAPLAFATIVMAAGCRASVPEARAVAGSMAGTTSNDVPVDVTPASVAEGDALFNRGACVRCHGAGGKGGENGPSLTLGSWLHGDGSFPRLVTIITTGVPREALKDASRRFAMNPRGGPMNLTDDQIRALAAYVHSISRDKQRR